MDLNIVILVAVVALSISAVVVVKLWTSAQVKIEDGRPRPAGRRRLHRKKKLLSQVKKG